CFLCLFIFFFFFSSRRRHTRFSRDWSSDVCSSDLLKPLYLYHRDFGNSHSEQIIADLSANLTSFYDEEINATHRWLPAESFKLSFEEEHMRSYIMDSWYLHYPLLQLGFLFEQGFEDPILRKQFEKSLLYLRQAAKEFDDQWPIFFNIYTFEIL